MRKVFAKVAVLLLIQGAAAAMAHATDVSVGISVVEPGVYGRVNIGSAPPPVVYEQPVVIVKQARPVEPIYLHVPPGHEKHWEKHCREYNACNRPVYFVKSAEYEPARHGRGHEREYDHDDHHDRDDHHHDHDRGHRHDD
jgi:hypothetical protein